MPVSRSDFYPLGDPIRPGTPNKRTMRAQWTGERRAPKAGEWYLSGAIVEAYRAPVDFATAYHIARVVDSAA